MRYMRWLALAAFLGLPAQAHVNDNVVVPDNVDYATNCVCGSYDLSTTVKHFAAINKLDPMLVLAVIQVESKCDPRALGFQNDSGLMQIIPKWHRDRIARLGVDNLFDAEQNIAVGTDYLGSLTKKHKERNALARYNGGGVPKPKAFAYADRVLKYKARLTAGQCQAQ